MHGIDIRPLTTYEEFEQAEALQRSVWGDAVITTNLLVSFVRNGAVLFGAVREGRVVGLVFGYLGIESPEAKRPAMANLKLASQRMAVLPEYRDQGLGFELKMAQRQFAITQGIRLITWTFDPLISRNGYLNIRKLGAIVREFKHDYYGTRPSSQVSLGSSDRAIVEWWITSNRVEQRVNGKRGGLGLQHYMDGGAVIINQAERDGTDFMQPSTKIARPAGQVILVEIPDNYPEMVEHYPDLARSWRRQNREIMEWALGTGYAVTDFVRGQLDGCARSFYALTSYYDVASGNGFSSN